MVTFDHQLGKIVWSGNFIHSAGEEWSTTTCVILIFSTSHKVLISDTLHFGLPYVDPIMPQNAQFASNLKQKMRTPISN